MRSLVERNGYDEADFCQRLVNDLFPLLEGKPRSGPGHYTSETMLSMGVGYGCILARLIQGETLDAQISLQPLKWLSENTMAFEPVTTRQPAPDHPELPLRARRHIVRDALHAAADIAAMAKDPAIRIEPAWKVSHLYGMPCAFYHQLPATWYLAARFSDDFESAVLHSINGGGQNQSRAMLAGALVGAQVGLDGIPPRFLKGLKRADELRRLAKALALQIAA